MSRLQFDGIIEVMFHPEDWVDAASPEDLRLQLEDEAIGTQAIQVDLVDDIHSLWEQVQQAKDAQPGQVNRSQVQF